MIPPTPLPALSIIQVRFKSTHLEQQFINTYHYLYDGDEESPDYRAEMDALWTGITVGGGLYETWRDCLNHTVALDECALQPIYPNRLAAVIHVFPDPNGTVPLDPLPVNCSAFIERRGDVANRQNVGGVKLPGMSVGQLSPTDGHWILGFMNNLTSHGEEIKTEIDALGAVNKFQPVLWNKTNPLNKTYITEAVASNEPRTMRRRGFRLGI